MNDAAVRPVSFAEAGRFWLVLGFISFGGPAGQIAILHRELVEKRRWLTEEQFLHALNFCMLLPGPEAQQLATYAGWLLHGVRGGIVAGVSFVLPSVLLLLGLSYVYAAHGTLAPVAAVLWGFKPVVAAIIFHAALRIGRRALARPALFAIAALAFAGISLLRIPFPWIVLASAIAGICTAAPGAAAPTGGAGRPASRPFRALLAAAGLWGAVFLLVVAVRGAGSLHAQQYLFFTSTAFVTFGGAYAVLAYVTQAAVESHGWISRIEAMDGLALAETTPGPLIMVLQFIGFLAAWHRPEGLSPLASAAAGALVTTWATFLPSISFILVGAPYVEALRGNRKLQSALQGITAAAVGVIVSLGADFGVAVAREEGTALGIAAVAFVLLERYRVGVHWLVIAAGLLGLSTTLLPA